MAYETYQGSTSSEDNNLNCILPLRLNSVVDSFRAAVIKIELGTSSNTQFNRFILRNETYKNIPEYLNQIKTPNPINLYNFLIEHQDLVDIIAFACSDTVKQFNDTTTFTLVICTDDNERYLELLIRQNPYQKNILEVIDKISEKFENLLVSRTGWFMITTDFNPPD